MLSRSAPSTFSFGLVKLFGNFLSSHCFAIINIHIIKITIVSYATELCVCVVCTLQKSITFTFRLHKNGDDDDDEHCRGLQSNVLYVFYVLLLLLLL